MKNSAKTFRRHFRKYLPFLIIFAAALVLIETQERRKGPLPPPQIAFTAPEQRAFNEKRDFILSDMADNPVHLADLKGQVVLLNFFATWCPPCVEEMPSIQNLYEAYHEQGFTVLGISHDDGGKDVLKRFIEQFSLTFPILVDPGEEVFDRYVVQGIPVTYLLDKRGRVVGMQTGSVDWNSPHARSLVEKLLQEPS